ncbi:MAG TPA: M48 family metallopeptidase [Steroidobacteraceae bacterium]|nr:M48 family metallopeptidase [Steroidobacteraceae bacterium]
MTGVPARLFGPGVPATGAPAELDFFADQLHVRSGELSAIARIPELRIREVGFGKQMGYELAWDDVEGTRAVHVLDPQAVSALLAVNAIASCAQMQSLGVARRRRAVGRGLGWASIAGFIALPLILILLFVWQADRIAGALAARIPIAEEIRLGQQSFADLRSSLTLADSGPAYDAVSQLGKRLSQGSKYPFEFHVATDPSINAFAMPGGIIVVHSGLIAATHRPEELAGVLAHEIQHVEQRHSLRAMFKQLGLRGLWALLTGNFGSSLIGQATFQLTSLQFSRHDESSADAKGFDALVQHDIDPRGMIDFFAIMEKQDGVNPPEFLSTHPADRERQVALQRQLSALKQHEFPPLQLGSWPP